jgi:peroxiredoxin
LMLLLTAGLIVSLLLAGLALFVAFQLMQQNGRILMRLEELESRPELPAPPALEPTSVQPDFPPGLPVGTPAPDFELPDLHGGKGSLAELRGRKVLLVFFSPRCGYCLDLAPRLAAIPWAKHGRGLAPVVVTNGTLEENLKMEKEYGLRGPVLLQEGMEVASRYDAIGTPIGYLIDEEGRIASEMAVGGDTLMALAELASAAGNESQQLGNKPLSESKIARDGLAPGTAAPDFRLPTVAGPELALSDLRGKPVLLVFSDPDCGPCLELAPKLEARGRERPDVQVLMVSRGTVDENAPKVAELGLTFPVGLQKKWEISRLYAMFGTPIGYLIDADGNVAAEAAVGARPILELLDLPAAPLNGKPAHGREVAMT